MNTGKRRKFNGDFKAKVVLAALKERNTVEELSRKYELHPTQINQWKKEAINNLSLVFASKAVAEDNKREEQVDKLYSQIGQLKVENDFLKKKLY